METEIGEVRRVALGPEDRIVLAVPEGLSAATVQALAEQTADVFDARGRVVVLPEDLGFAVVGPEPPERAVLEKLVDLVLDGLPRSADARPRVSDGQFRARVEAVARTARRDFFETGSPGSD